MNKAIIEGADCTGKTTYANRFANSELSVVHYGMYREMPVNKQLELFRAFMDLPESIVFDRSPISEYIYSKYRGVKPWFTSNDVCKLVNQEYGQCTIYLFIPNRKLVKRLVELTDQPDWVKDNIIDIIQDYEFLAAYFNRTRNVVSMDNSDNLVKAIKKLEERNDNNTGFRDSSNSTLS